MPTSLTFYTDESLGTQVSGSAANISTVQIMVYDDGAGNKYTFGVDGSNNNEFKTFKYESGSNGAVDYSALAKEFMKGGGVGTLLGKLTTIDTNVGLVKDKTDNMPDNLKTELAPLTAAAGKITVIETAVGSAPLAPMFTGLAQETTLATAAGKITAIETAVGSAPLAPMFTGLAQETTLATAAGKITAIETAVGTGSGSLGEALGKLDTKVGLVKDKTDKLDPTDATTDGTLGKVLSELAKANQLPANLTERLEVLNLADITKGLGKILKDIQDKTDNLDPEDTAEGTLGKALETISAEATANLNALKALFDALNPAVTSGGLGKALSELAKADQLPANLAERLEVLNLADTNKGLGKALSELATAQRLSEINEKLTIVELDPPKDPISSEPQSNSGYTQNEDMLGKHSPDQFLG